MGEVPGQSAEVTASGTETGVQRSSATRRRRDRLRSDARGRRQRLDRRFVCDDVGRGIDPVLRRFDPRALEQLRLLAGELEHAYPGAAGSLREGIEETLTLTRLGVTGSLKRTLESSNPCESMIEIVRRTQRTVKRWSSGEMALRWTAAGMLEAERQFRRIINLAIGLAKRVCVAPVMA